MKKYLFKHLTLIIAITFSITKSQAQSLPITSYGVWDRGGGIPDYSSPNADFVKGIETTLDWKDIQAGPGTNCDFSAFQTILDVAVANNKLIRFSVNVGPDCPLWVFDNGVPLVNVISNAPKNDAYANRNPYYPDPEYKAYYFEMIRQFALFLRDQPQEKFDHIAFVQVKTGATGDEEPYKGDVINPIYDLTLAQWEAFRLEAFAKFKENFNDVTNRKIVLTFNNVDPVDEPDAYDFVMNELDPVLGFGLKGGAYNRGHHLSDEQSYKEQWNPFLINPKVGPGNPNGVKLFSASEMDQSWDKGYFALNYEIGFYWSALGGINTGLSCTNVSVSAMTYALANPGIIDIFKMYNRYAQQVYPATATTAFSVFHEGLNSADTVKFPVSTYGTASQPNLTRYQNICNDPKYYNRGARIDDPVAVVRGQVYQRESQDFYNDAGWDICEGNIERFMTQINPDATSIGLFRVRGTLTSTSSKYDRFARSFENSTSKNTMYFQLHTELPVNNKTLKFTIIWLDKTAGSTWAFKYRNAAGLQAIPFTGTGTNQWRTETITLSDAIMNKGGALQSDFMLANTDTTDDIFNGIEMNIIQDQTINFNALPSKKVGDADFSPGATASSGLAVTYTSSNINVATIVDNKIHIVGSGACTITASQAGDNYYHPASSVSQYLAVAVETKTTINTTGTWTAPASINKIKVEAWGGGGGGGGTSLAGFAGGGAGGSYVINDSVIVVPATSYTVTVGTAGGQSATGSGANGYNGSNTTFGSTTPVIANGGVGGSGTNTTGQLGAGGTNSSGGSGGIVAIGLPGVSGASGSGGAGGAGAGALGGSGGGSRTTINNGYSGTAPGGGGGGAYGSSSGVNRGATGGAGRIIITYSVGAPDAPIIGTATVSGVSGQASIPFTAPAFNGNTTITSYTATSSPGGITATLSQAGSGSIIVNGLTIGTAYTFTVRATNSIGSSPESSASNAVIPYKVPDAPTIGTAALTGINGQATISFTAPAYNGGSPITSYVATSSPGGITGTLSQAGSGSITVNGLSDGNTYTFTVKAANVAGLSAASGTSNAVLPEYRTPQTITFGALSAVNYGDAVLPGATASSGLPVTYSSSNPLVATTSGSTITVVGSGSATITASQGGNVEYAPATPVSQTLVVNKITLSITTPSIASKVYNALPASGLVTPGTLSGFVGTESVSVTATGLYTNANVGTAKLATITYTLVDGINGGKAVNYSLASGTAEGAITQSSLMVTGVVANNKFQGENTTATLSSLGSLSGVFASDATNVTLNSSSVSANFDTATAGVAIPITISGYSISGSASANYSLFQPTGITANIEPPATITALGVTTFCSGGSVTLSANTGSGRTYLWSTGATTQSIVVTASGSYTVTLTSAGGSSTSAATTVTVNGLTTNGSVTTSICAGGSYTWPATGVVYTTAQTGLTDTAGCNTATLNLTVTPAPASAGTSGSLVICAGTSVSASSLYEALGGTKATGGAWSATSGGAGTYTYTQAATSPCTVNNTATITVTEQAAPASAGTSANLVICAGTSVNASSLYAALGGTKAIGGTWSATIGGAGTYTYTQAATSPCAINNTATITVTEQAAPASAGTSANLVICAGASVNESSLYAALGGTKAIGGTWSATSGGAGTYTYTQAATSPCTIPNTATVTVTEQAVPNAGTSGSLSLTSSPSDAALFAALTGADTGGSWSRPLSGFVGVYTYTVNTTTPCTGSDTSTVTVTISTLLPTADSTYTLCAGTKVSGLVAAATINGSSGVKIYAAATGGSSIVLSGTTDAVLVTSVTPRAYYLTEPKLSGESDRVRVFLVVKALPPTPSALVLTYGTTTVTTIGSFGGTGIELKLTATATGAATYKWTLPYGADRVDGLTTNTIDNYSYVRFTGTGEATPLVLSVRSVNASGCISATAKTISLSRAKPTALTTLTLSSASTGVITKVGPYMGVDKTFTLAAGYKTTPAQGLTPTSYRWVLPKDVICNSTVTSISVDQETGISTIVSSSSTIDINFKDVTTPSITSLPIEVYAVNSVGSSAKKSFSFLRSKPTALTTLTLSSASTGVITKVGPYMGVDKTFTLTAGYGTATAPLTAPAQGLEATKYRWVLPAGVLCTSTGVSKSEDGLTIISSTTTIDINFKNVSTPSGILSLPINVYAVNGAGTSATKLLSLTRALPAVVATVSGSLKVCNRGAGFSYTITAPAGATKYLITAPVGSVVSSDSNPLNATNILTTSDLTFKVIYDGTTAFLTTDNKLTVKSVNGSGPCATAKSLILVKLASCDILFDVFKELALVVADKFVVVAYPNPSSDAFNIAIQSSSKGVTNVQVYDISGRRIENRQVKSTSVEIGKNYASGVYNVIVNQGTKVKTLRLVKQ